MPRCWSLLKQFSSFCKTALPSPSPKGLFFQPPAGCGRELSKTHFQSPLLKKLDPLPNARHRVACVTKRSEQIGRF
jgi:hypothetical protein